MSVQSGFTEFPTNISPNKIQRPTFRQVHVKSIFEPAGQSPVTNDFNNGLGDHWDLVMTTFPLEYRDAQRFEAVWAKVGLYGQIAIQDPMFKAPGSDGERPAQANPLVNGASQTGRSIIYDGASATTLVVAQGQHFQIGTQLFQADADETSDGAGAGTITFWPALRTSPANDAVIDINDPFLHALLLNVPEVDIRKANITPPISVAFMELIQ